MRVSILVEIVLQLKLFSCLCCPSVVRYDGIRAHVKSQHPDVQLPKGFIRNLTPQREISQTGESCSCKYYSFVSFFINNGMNIEKGKVKSEYKFIEEYR